MFDLVDKYKFLVRKIIRQRTGATNQDLEQEVFFRLWQKQDKYCEQGKEKSWVCVVTTNMCSDYFKSKHYSQSQKNIELPDYLPDTRYNPEETISARQRQKIILGAVNSLPRKLKQAIVLQEFEGMSLDEIASRQSVPVGTVKSRLHTARNILAEKLYWLETNELSHNRTRFKECKKQKD